VADIFYYVQSRPLLWQFGEAGREVVDCIHLPWVQVQDKPSVNTSHELSGSMEGGHFLCREQSSSVQNMILFDGNG